MIEKSGHNELFSADAYGNSQEYEGIKTSLERTKNSRLVE